MSKPTNSVKDIGLVFDSRKSPGSVFVRVQGKTVGMIVVLTKDGPKFKKGDRYFLGLPSTLGGLNDEVLKKMQEVTLNPGTYQEVKVAITKVLTDHFASTT